jgi:hypothetical protein
MLNNLCYWESFNVEKFVEPNRRHMTIGHMIIACLIPNATDTNTEYVTILAFPLQKWLHKCASLSYYVYVAQLVHFKF